MATRRRFLQVGSVAGAGLFLYYRNGLPRLFAAPIRAALSIPATFPST
jgi:hypothetical protein